MTNKLPIVGKKYAWRHAPHRYHLVIGLFKNKIVAISDKYLDNNDEEALGCVELMTIEGFKCLTNLEEYRDGK